MDRRDKHPWKHTFPQPQHIQDVLVVTAPGSGAEIIPFLKTWVNLPIAVAFTVAYAEVGYALLQHASGISMVVRIA